MKTPFWKTPTIKEKIVPKFTEVTTTSSGRVAAPVNLEPYTNLLTSQDRRKNITLPLEEGEKPRVIMQYLNTAASSLGMKLYRIESSATQIVFRIVTERGPNKKK